MSRGVGRSRRRFVALASVAGALLVAGFATWYFVFRDVVEPTTVGEAVMSFRQSTTEAPGRSPVPVGVYVYATSGFERTSALTGATHRYPARSTITVTRDSCGVRMRWDVLHGRSTTWTFCIDPAGWIMAKQDERHTFFGVTEATSYRCSSAPFRTPGDAPGKRVAVVCRTQDTAEHELQWVVGHAVLRVGNARVDTVHVRQTTTLSGGSRGPSAYDIWLARRSGVPVRIAMVSHTTNASPVGDVRYDEVVTLRLLSLTPRR